MRCLLVIDMQEKYLRNNYRKEELIDHINKTISQYPPENVIYIVQRAKINPESITKDISIVSDKIFEKRKADSFSNYELLSHLREIAANEVELVGIDGNYCVKATAIGGIANCFSVLINLSAVGTSNGNKFAETQEKLNKLGVQFI